MEKKRTYHHGTLRSAVLDEAARMIASEGVEAVTLRELARRAGVSHAAPAHHFGDRRGLLTALATDGHARLAEALEAAGSDFLEAAVAYVRFALAHPGHFAVMFNRDLVHAGDPDLIAARASAGAFLASGVAGLPVQRRGRSRAEASVAAWSLVHGLASLWLQGALPESMTAEAATPEELTRRIARLLFR